MTARTLDLVGVVIVFLGVPAIVAIACVASARWFRRRDDDNRPMEMEHELARLKLNIEYEQAQRDKYKAKKEAQDNG